MNTPKDYFIFNNILSGNNLSIDDIVTGYLVTRLGTGEIDSTVSTIFPQDLTNLYIASDKRLEEALKVSRKKDSFEVVVYSAIYK